MVWLWWTWVYDAQGRRHERSTKQRDHEAAVVAAVRLEREAADPADTAARKASLTDALALLIERRKEEAKAGKRSEATVAFYRRKSGQLIRVFEHGGDADAPWTPYLLAHLTAAEVDRYISVRRADGVSESTIHKELVALRAALKLSRRAGLWAGEPEAIIPIAFSPEYKPVDRWLPPAELLKLLAELADDRAARVAFIVATSANWAESNRAQVDDFDTDLAAVHVRGTKTAYRDRIVPIVLPAAKSLLEHALRYCRGAGEKLFRPWNNVRRDLHEACTRAGIDPCSPNDLRHTTATWLHARGATPDLISPVLGHADTKMVERVYGRLPAELLAERQREALGLPAMERSAVEVKYAGMKVLMEPMALPKPRKLLKEVPRGGIEPPTRGFSVPCSTD